MVKISFMDFIKHFHPKKLQPYQIEMLKTLQKGNRIIIRQFRGKR
jgi:hypothetical protein